jgi:isopentenyl-diphosphate delta-isomerase
MGKINVILVDENDKAIGFAEKLEAHQKGLLHRAVSVFIFNSQGKWLLQQRSMEKYHSRGLWSNTACSHPFENESNKDAAVRRLSEEMGISTDLTEIFSFIYRAELDNSLIEYELDHVFVGITDDLPIPNIDEVINYKYVDFDTLKADIEANPEKYSAWFKKIYQRVFDIWSKNYKNT